MRLVVLVGSDERLLARNRRSVLAQAGSSDAEVPPSSERVDVERIDVAVDGGTRLVEAVTVPSLFGPARVVDARNLDAADDTTLAALAAGADASECLVVASASTLLAGTRKRLPAHELVECKPPSGMRDISTRLRDEAALAAITLSNSQVRMLAERCADDLPRAYQVIDALAVAGIAVPSDRQVEVLAGSASAPVRPWELFAMLQRGDLPAALVAAADMDSGAVFAFTGWLRPRLLGAARCRALDIRSAEQAASVIAGTAARDAPGLATRLGGRTDEAVAVIGKLEDRLRSTGVDVSLAFDAALVALHGLLGRRN